MERHIDQELSELKKLILEMGANVEEAIGRAVEGLVKRDEALCESVFEIEKKINQTHLQIDDLCLSLLARQSPMATNLRLVVAIIKMNTDLERMGDQAINVAQNAKFLIKEEPIKPLIDIPKMALEVKTMVNEALKSFMDGDQTLTESVFQREIVVDALKKKIFSELRNMMQNDQKVIKQAIDLILISRNLERLGDHCTNIAEEVIFVLTGKDIRHGQNKENLSP